jgi:transposase InsO family protein
MHLLGIASIHSTNFPYKKSRITAEEKALIHNMILDLNITHPNQVWTTDITYIKTIYDGTLYLISFIDQFSKKVVGWYLGRSQKAVDVEIALQNAIKKRNPLPGLIIHSDKGSQFRSKLYRSLLAENHFIYSYTEINHSCDQNAAQESWHATIKKEWLSTRKLYHYEDAFKTIFDFIEGFYNPKRLHSSIGYLSPIDFENKYEMEKMQ